MIVRPFFSASISPAFWSTEKWADMVGLETAKWSDNSPADMGRWRSSCSTRRRVGSERALNTLFTSLYLANHRIIVKRPRFLLPIPVLRKVFRNKFTDGLEQLYRKGLLDCGGPAKAFADQAQFSELLEKLRHKEWVVYAKPPFGDPAHVLRYLGRYTHRIAISNHRLLDFDGEKVAFRYKDYAHGGKQRIMTLHATEFLRRFFLHVLPRGFVRIRHFGLLANRFRNQMLPLARTLLARNGHQPLLQPAPIPSAEPAPLWHCPRCGGPMRVARRLT